MCAGGEGRDVCQVRFCELVSKEKLKFSSKGLWWRASLHNRKRHHQSNRYYVVWFGELRRTESAQCVYIDSAVSTRFSLYLGF